MTWVVFNEFTVESIITAVLHFWQSFECRCAFRLAPALCCVILFHKSEEIISGVLKCSTGGIDIFQWGYWKCPMGVLELSNGATGQSAIKKKTLGDDECPLAGDELQPTGLGDELRSFMIFLPIFFMSDLDARFVATKLWWMQMMNEDG